MQIFHIILPLFMAFVYGANATAAPDYVYEYEDEPEQASPIPLINSLKEEANAARTRGVPILVEFSTPWCRYCEALEEQVLLPLVINGKYSDRLIVKKLEVTTYSSIEGFDGRSYKTDQISRQYDVDLYPTLLFLDADGREVGRRIVGITVLEYVAGELEQAIEAALKATATAL